MREDAYATESRIVACDNQWVCPGCAVELGNVGGGEHLCPNCGRKIVCGIELEPTTVTRLVDPREFRRTIQ